MFEIKNKVIKITKGDSASFRVDVLKDKVAYTLQSGDKLKFTVRKKPNSDVLMQCESLTNIIVLDPVDTKNLEVGSCCYDVELDTADGGVHTVCGLDHWVHSNMLVLPEITE